MKICLPTTGGKGLTEKVHDHFGSAPFFTVYDTESQNVQVLENDNPHHAHGACQPLGLISGLGIDAILTSGIGRRAVQLLNEGGIKVYLLVGATVQEAVEKFTTGALPEMTFDNACAGHGCHG